MILDLHGRGLKLDSAADIAPLLAGVDPAQIHEIHLGGNTIGVGAAEALAAFLEKTQVLKVADFADIFTGRLISEIPPALTAICNALKDKTSLVEINLSDNAFGGRSVDPMVPFLTHNRSFQILKLNNNGLGPVGGAVIANALRESAILTKADGKTSNLRTVICGRNRLENGSAKAWADAFAEHGTLAQVRMPQNGIRMEGIIALAGGLAKSPSLQHIDLQDNTFTEDGATAGVSAWSKALASWPDLRVLNLSDCVLSDEGGGIPSLLSALANGSNPKLHTLQLQNNNLDTATFDLLSQNIAESLPALLHLELQWNDTEDDCEHLENLGLALKARGGKLFVTDEDEEEEEEEEAKEEEEKEAAHEGVAEKDKELIDVKKVPAAVDKATDDLADLLSKVSLK